MKDIPAFPRTQWPNEIGMTLRDYFAAKAMQGYCADTEFKKECGQEDTAISAYKMADAMIKERKV